MNLKTPLGRVRGLGSAKSGAQHFWAQRASAAALIPLTVWFLASIIAYAGADYETAMVYLRRPLVAALFVLLIGTSFWHMRLGLQVVIEDYIAREATKIALLLLVNFLTVGLGVVAGISILKIAFSP
jgi:succinate dehydrogenase / fumarate reductase membrane anchor subunit